MKILFVSLAVLVLLWACNTSSKVVTTPLSQAEQLVNKTIAVHGGTKYDLAHYQFTFREKQYTFHNQAATYKYTVTSEKDGQKIVDVLDHNGLKRSINGEVQELSEKQIRGYTGGLNSVIYFATLPHKLQDAAVKKAYKGETSIKGKKYHVLEITFGEEGGGTDHDDQFHYWINQADNTIDYIAYNYQVSGGGVRFREAYNRRTVEGIIFQDYVNYKAAVGTPLADLPALFEQEKLKKLSVIETENVKTLN